MRAAVALVLFTVSLLAQDARTIPALTAACGPADVRYNVVRKKLPPPLDWPRPGKALVYVIQNDTYFYSTPKPITRVGLDGAWVGATRDDTYIYFEVEPGEHDLCGSWQPPLGFGSGRGVATTHFMAESGRAYYFGATNVFWCFGVSPCYRQPVIRLQPLPTESARELTSILSFSHAVAR